ncbi:MAG: D-alanine--D-alanine ligase [Candidatus Latescibacteria bacterium]|nr:D-alanine--D-alanine ligase [Candidatus Latescibacterota bacterium]
MIDIKRKLQNKKIGILMGGWSSEREVSLRSGENVFQSLIKQGFKAVKIDIAPNFTEQIRKAKIEIAFIALHGKPGEDGTIQGFLELLNIPYTGSDVVASAIGMDKIMTKRLFEYAHIPTPKYFYLPKDDSLQNLTAMINRKLRFPVIIKPRTEGSSVGCVIIDHSNGLQKQCRKVQKEFGNIFIEEFIGGMIATVGILGQQVLPILELVPKKRRFYDFRAKYTKGETEFIIPARLCKPVYEKIQELALKAHNIIGAKGFSRVDLVVKKNKPFFLEINTLPGMTELSDLPAQARHIGISYDELVLEILKSALETTDKNEK